MDDMMLFIDVEWNQIGKRLGPSDEILEIAALSSMGEYVVDRYFKYIKPVKKVNRQTFNFLGITPNDFKLLTGLLVIISLIIASTRQRASEENAKKKALSRIKEDI